MAYTTTDLDEIIAAIVALAKGQRTVRFKINNKEVEYARASLQELKDLREEVSSEIAAAAGTSDDFAFVQTSKGY